MVNPPAGPESAFDRFEQQQLQREMLIQSVRPRARESLSKLAKAVRKNPGTGQRRRITAFLGGLFNGNHYPFDLTDLRGLDSELREACLSVLAYDSLGHQELHGWGVIDQEELVSWLKDDGHFYAAQQRQKAREMYRARYGEDGHRPAADED